MRKLAPFLIFFLLIPLAEAKPMNDYIRDYETTLLSPFDPPVYEYCPTQVDHAIWVNKFHSFRVSRRFDNFILVQFNQTLKSISPACVQTDETAVKVYYANGSYFAVRSTLNVSIQYNSEEDYYYYYLQHSFALPLPSLFDIEGFEFRLYYHPSIACVGYGYDFSCRFNLTFPINSSAKVYNKCISNEGEEICGSLGLFRVIAFNSTFPFYPANLTHCFYISNLDRGIRNEYYSHHIYLTAKANGQTYAYKDFSFSLLGGKEQKVCDDWLVGLEELSKDLVLNLTVVSTHPPSESAHYFLWSFKAETLTNVSAILFPPYALPPAYPQPSTLYPRGCAICDYSQLNPHDLLQYFMAGACLLVNLLACNPILLSLVVIFVIFLGIILELRRR